MKMIPDSQYGKEGIIKVAILTTYLTEDFAEKYQDSQERLNVHIEKYGYDPKNFKDTRQLVTPKRIVLLETDERHTVEKPHLCDFAVAGSTETMEDAVFNMRGTGIIVARYSTFYNGTSRYTGNTAAEGGYSLDMPKRTDVVKSFLTNDNVLDAIVAREEAKIRQVIDEFNRGLAHPVLITPYLAEALKVQR